MLTVQSRLIYGLIKWITKGVVKLILKIIKLFSLQFALLVLIFGGILYLSGGWYTLPALQFLFYFLMIASVVYALVSTVRNLLGLGKKSDNDEKGSTVKEKKAKKNKKNKKKNSADGVEDIEQTPQTTINPQPQLMVNGQPVINGQPQYLPYQQPQPLQNEQQVVINAQPQPTTYEQMGHMTYGQPQPNSYAQPQPTTYEQMGHMTYGQPQPNSYGQPQYMPYEQPQPSPCEQSQGAQCEQSAAVDGIAKTDGQEKVAANNEISVLVNNLDVEEKPVYYAVKNQPGFVMAEFSNRYELYLKTENGLQRVRVDYKG